MLILKLGVAIAVIGVMLFTPLLITILTVGIFYFVTMNGVAAAKIEAGFGRVFLMILGCIPQWLVLSVLFSDAELLQTGLIYLGLILIVGVPLDALEGLFKVSGHLKQSREIQIYQSNSSEIVDAEVVDD
jgi:hypothetical protein